MRGGFSNETESSAMYAFRDLSLCTHSNQYISAAASFLTTTPTNHAPRHQCQWHTHAMILRSPSLVSVAGNAVSSGRPARRAARIAARPSIAAHAGPNEKQDETEAPSYLKKICMGAALGSMSVVLLFSSMPSQAYAQTYTAVQDEVEMDASSQAGQVCGVCLCVTSGCNGGIYIQPMLQHRMANGSSRVLKDRNYSESFCCPFWHSPPWCISWTT